MIEEHQSCKSNAALHMKQDNTSIEKKADRPFSPINSLSINSTSTSLLLHAYFCVRTYVPAAAAC